MQIKYFVKAVTYSLFSFLLLLGINSQAQQQPLGKLPATKTLPTVPVNGNTAGAINKKLNLEDITVKGELLGDDRMNFVRRQREELKNRIKFRTNFRPEILQEYKN